MEKKYLNINRGFTLIELLVAISIVGLLASIVVQNVNNARIKGKDTFIRTEAAQMRTILEEEYSETGSYLGLLPSVWIFYPSDCDAAAFTGNHVDEARAICKSIVSNASVTWTGFKFWMGVQFSPSNKYSIMVALPAKNTFLCLGSSGVTSDTTTTASWGLPGCYGNP